MKKIFAFLLALALMLSAAAALADTRITVSGEGAVRVSADTAVVSLGVSARDQDVLKAQQQVNTVIAEIRGALTEAGVKEEDINTDFINIYAVYDYREDRELITAYNASSTLAIRITDMDIVGRVIDLAFAAGANTLNGIEFSASNTASARNEAMKEAMADARARAEVLAEAAGLKISGISEISENGSWSFTNSVGNYTRKAFAEEAGAADTVVQSAKLVVSATVSVVFEAE